MRKIAFILSLLFLAYSLSMCKNVFSAFSEPVTENYYQIFLPKTGQTTVYQSGDDGTYQRGAAWPNPRFIDNGNGTVTDRLTGLMWQQNGSASGTLNWQGALNYVKTQTTGGYTDWRLPNANELRSLMHYGQANPAAWLNTQGFTSIQLTNGYWSSTTYGFSKDRAWYLYTNTSESNRIDAQSKGIISYVIAVRGNGNGGAITIPKTGQTTCYDASGTVIPCAGTGQDGEYQRGISWPSPRFIDNGNGTVTDRLTGLMWQQNGSASGTKNWQDALNYVKTLTTGGYTDWRIPNSNELKSLVNYGLSDSAAWLNSQGFNGIQLNIYWSASTVASVTAGAWYVIMNNGREFYSGKINTSYVLAVRGGQ